MKYEEWRKLEVSTSDLRTLMLNDGSYEFCDKPVPGVAYMKPFWVDHGPGGRRIERFDCLGHFSYDPARARWDVTIENTEEEFVSHNDAARYLWENWWKDNLDVQPYRLIAVDREGEIVINRKCVSEQHMLDIVEQNLKEAYGEIDPDTWAEVKKDLTTVGSRFHEWQGGHFAAFPIEE